MFFFKFVNFQPNLLESPDLRSADRFPFEGKSGRRRADTEGRPRARDIEANRCIDQRTESTIIVRFNSNLFDLQMRSPVTPLLILLVIVKVKSIRRVIVSLKGLSVELKLMTMAKSLTGCCL